MAAWLALLPLPGISAADDAPWAVKDAPYRAVVRLRKPPSHPEAGVEIKVPDLGVVHSHGGEYALADAAGHPLPVAVAWQAEGQTARLLANGLNPNQDYFLYIGGSRGATWTPKTSLLLETRHSPTGHGEGFNSLNTLQAAWGSAPTQGAEFVEKISSANNPFGEPTNFLSHYSGYLAPTATDVELSTSSSDASFVQVNDQLFVESPGKHSPTGAEKSLRPKKLPASPTPVKIDYYHAKGDDGEPTMCLFWKHNGHIEVIPPEAWLHPGAAEAVRYEAVHGGPVPAPGIESLSYVGWGGGFLYEVHCTLAATPLAGATVEWHFDDGGVFTGPECTRIMAADPPVQRVTVIVKRGNEAVQSVQRIGFFGQPPKTAEGNQEHQHYLELLGKQDPATLSVAMLGAALPFLVDNGTDAQVAPYANAWLKAKHPPNDPLWLSAESARLRAIAETNPKAALAELTNNVAAHELYGKPLDLLEVELIVFYTHELASVARVQQIAFGLGSTPEGRLAAVRIGDLYRLNGDIRQAVARYEAAQPPDDSGGRKLPAEDQANSMTVDDLIERGDRQAAEAKLAEWEIAHPMAKFTTDFLLLRSRVMTLYGRWRESLTELDAYAASHPDSSYQIEVDFYRAQALSETGKKDEARKIWGDIAKNYPKSEYADSSKKLLKTL